MAEFKIGKTYSTRSICDHNCIFQGTVIKRTKSFITLKVDSDEVRVKIHVRDNEEFCYPFGRYSMAPIFKASRETEQNRITII